uniref:3-hydroxyacyl-CoA dehydrogenase NAD-binding domain-containing protein n=1 Tax=Oleiagrimonas sp. TaxID=2010330 RepID=UPI00261A43EC
MFDGLRFKHWQADADKDGIVILALDRAGSNVNALSRAVIDELGEIVERLSIEAPRGVIIHSAKDAGFAVGADLHEFITFARDNSVMQNIRNGQKVFEKLARLPCPTVAAVHGACMGGGTELALACDQRVAVDDPGTRIGLPEVMLGIHPGWGGTARLPRLIGAPQALQAMLTGHPFSARRARSVGLVDALCNADALLETARERIGKKAKRPILQRLLAWSTHLWPLRQVLARIVLKQTAGRVRKEHYPAPFALIEVWRRGGSDIGQRLILEARSVTRLADTSTARNLIRVFFLRERLKGLGSDVAHDIEHVHVVGAGTMGGDIAAWSAFKGFQVTLQDREMKYIEPALQRARTLYEKKLKSDDKVREPMARLRADVDGTGVADADLVIEAIYENIEAKQQLYAKIEPQLQENGLLATNTSSIPLDQLRENLERPERFFGLHFFNPVAKMPLVEVVRHDQLDEQAEKRALAFCKAIGKLPIAVAGTPGFLVNRILMPYLLESMRLLNEGVPGPVLDKAARKFGMPMGPIELADTVGLDVAASVGRELAPFLGLDIPEGLDDLLEEGRRGKKDGKGFYVWENGKPVKPEVDPDYTAAADLTDRMLLPMVNEAVACLHDHVVDEPDLLDAGVIFGIGFAPFRGGPIQYIRETGADAVRGKLEELARRHGDRFRPRDGWDNPLLNTTP